MVFVDRFSAGLDDLTHKEQQSPIVVAAALAKLGRFSVFEATENQTIARTMTCLADCGWFKFDNSIGFPWTKVTLTDKGHEAIFKAGDTA